MDTQEDKIIEYLDGQMDTQEALAFEERLKTDTLLNKKFMEMKEIFEQLDTYSSHRPSERLNQNFSKFIAAELEKNNTIVTPNESPIGFKSNVVRFMSYSAAAVALILVGVLISQNYYQDKQLDLLALQIDNTRFDMLALLENKSTSKRIEAVNISYKMPEANDEILNALINTMNQDESSNVRLAAVRALEKFTDNKEVVNAFIETLQIQKDATVTIAVIDILSSIKEQRAIKSFEKILTDDAQMEFVKDEAKVGLYKLNTI